MKSKLIFGSAIVGVLVILLTISGGITAVSYASVQYQQLTATANNLEVDYLLEDMRITAGIESAALVQLHLFGGPEPAITSSSLFDDKVINWLFILSDQENYEDYLLRRPLRAPDNYTLALEISSSLGTSGSLDRALAIAELFSVNYNTILRWSGAEQLPNGNYLYIFTGGATASHFAPFLNEITTDIDDGMAPLVTQTILDQAPVKVLAIGQGTVPIDEYGNTIVVPIRAIYFVATNAITGTTTYTLSTDNIFGQDVAPFDKFGYIAYSELHFRFPYTINPITIDPEPDNFAPQITGKMDWVLTKKDGNRPPSNYEVVYEINNEVLVSAPRVSINMGYNQTKLRYDGILQMDYTITNTGTETAQNITISYPLGEDFVNYIANKPDLFRLRDDVTIDESIYTEINATIIVDFEGDLADQYDDINIDVRILALTGWYINNTNGEWVDWDPNTTSVLIKSDYFEVTGIVTGSVNTSIILHDPDGLEQILVAKAIEFLAPINLNDYIGDWGQLLIDYKQELFEATASAADMLFHLLYQPQSVFDPNLMDFEFITKTIGFGEHQHTEYFLQTVVPSLAPGETATVSWALENITSQFMTFGVMRPELLSNGDGTNAINIVTEEHNFEEVMQMLFAIADDYIPNSQFATGRFISFYDRMADIWISSGARFSYLDEQGFEYFGFSNGINFQLADDEAVLNVNVALNQTGYKVGDPVHIDFTIQNTGDIAAENVRIYLVHGRMGRDWQIKDPDVFYVEDIGTIAAGETYTGSVDTLANTFLGIHPVYAVVEFDSDYGQGPLDTVNWFTGEHNFFDGAKQTHEMVLSNMDWAMLLPKTNARRPAFPQPVLDIQTISNFIIDKTPWELEIQYVITNVGDEPTTITVIQYYNTSEMELLSRTTTKGSIGNGTYLGMGVVIAENIRLEPGESVTVTMRWMFLTSQGCYIPGAQVIYDSRFENEIGGDIEGEGGEGGGTTLLSVLDGQSQDTNQWEDYGESTSTGSSAGADIYTGGEHTRRIGAMDILYISIASILVATVAIRARKRK